MLIVTGTENASYDDIDYSGANFTHGGLATDGVTVNAGYKFGGAAMKIMPGKLDMALPLAREEMFEASMHNAELTDVVLYDTKCKKAWLLDGASILLHMSRASLSHDQSYIRRLPGSERLVQQLRYPNSSSSSHRTAYQALVDDHNRELPIREARQQTDAQSNNVHAKSWTFEDHVQALFSVFEQIKGHQAKLAARTQVNFSNPISHVLHGWGFVDIISGRSVIKPRSVKLKGSAGAWLKFTKGCGSITLMGSGFGELIWPSTPDCRNSVVLPSNQDLLAAPIQRLKGIARMHGSINEEYVQLAQDVFWHEPYNSVSSHPCRCSRTSSPSTRRCCKPVVEPRAAAPERDWKRRFHRSKKKDQVQKEDIFVTCFSGAVIFGRESDWKMLGSQDRMTVVADSTPVLSEIDSGVDLAGPSTGRGSSQTS